MKSQLKKFQVTNPVTGETFEQIRRVPRVYANIDLTPGDNPVQQQFKNECDINFIVKNYQIPQQTFSPDQFGDFSDPLSFQQSMNIVAHAQQQFLLLPAEIRARFQNEPQKMLEFIADPENAQELIKMGLATKELPKPIPDPVKVIIANPEASEDSSSTPPTRKPTK